MCRHPAARGGSRFLLGSENTAWARTGRYLHFTTVSQRPKVCCLQRKEVVKTGRKCFGRETQHRFIYVLQDGVPSLRSSEAPSACPDLQLLLPQLAPFPAGTKTLCKLLPAPGTPSPGSLRSVPGALLEAKAPQDAHHTHLHPDTSSETLPRHFLQQHLPL